MNKSRKFLEEIRTIYGWEFELNPFVMDMGNGVLRKTSNHIHINGKYYFFTLDYGRDINRLIFWRYSAPNEKLKVWNFDTPSDHYDLFQKL